jgi:hypothetical protein
MDTDRSVNIFSFCSEIPDIVPIDLSGNNQDQIPFDAANSVSEQEITHGHFLSKADNWQGLFQQQVGPASRCRCADDLAPNHPSSNHRITGKKVPVDRMVS